jgi:hypothetical protein
LFYKTFRRINGLGLRGCLAGKAIRQAARILEEVAWFVRIWIEFSNSGLNFCKLARISLKMA